jgi:hypothetical protein
VAGTLSLKLNEYTRLPPVFGCTAILNGENCVAKGEFATGVIAPAFVPDCVMLKT